MARTLPTKSGSVTHVKAEIIADAPIEVVWNTLMDFSSYGQWNPFVRSQSITDASYKPLSEQPVPSEGDHLLLKVRIPPKGLDDVDTGLSQSKEIITYVDKINHGIGWKQDNLPNWLLNTHRWQDLEEIDLDGKKHTKYTTLITFTGPLAYMVKWLMVGKLTTSFRAMAEGLKTRSEYLAKNS
ncbi:hypothetical protein BU17DRAFT_53764 [Hysterangium stoloniferum]|nr:hypothetical protein BU17DRAFT_53764 [Hysterangium stoloniferum]